MTGAAGEWGSLIIVQERWDAADAATLAALLQAALAAAAPGDEPLVLLPLADRGGEAGEAACLERVGALARQYGVAIAGAVRVESDDGPRPVWQPPVRFDHHWS